MILAVASKNNPADALEVIDHHPEMVLRRNDFACLEIHWNPKSESLPRIAHQLNLGLESFVFWDDEPREREVVRSQHPAVFVPEVCGRSICVRESGVITGLLRRSKFNRSGSPPR